MNEICVFVRGEKVARGYLLKIYCMFINIVGMNIVLMIKRSGAQREG